MDPWGSKRAAGRSTTSGEVSTVWPHPQHERLATQTRRRFATQQGAILERNHRCWRSRPNRRRDSGYDQLQSPVTISARANSRFTVVQQHQWQDCVCSNTTTRTVNKILAALKAIPNRPLKHHFCWRSPTNKRDRVWAWSTCRAVLQPAGGLSQYMFWTSLHRDLELNVESHILVC